MRLFGRTIGVAASLLFFLSTPVFAADFYVSSEGGNNLYACTSSAQPCATIMGANGAMAKASAAGGKPHTIHVRSSVSPYAERVVMQAQINLRGGYSSDWVWNPITNPTTISPGSTVALITADQVTVEGFNLTSTSTYPVIKVTGGAVTIQKNNIMSGQVGIQINSAINTTLVIRNNQIKGNSVAGIRDSSFLSSGLTLALTINNNVIANNGTTNYFEAGNRDSGGGITVTLTNNTLTGAQTGLNRTTGSSTITSKNNIIYGNASYNVNVSNGTFTSTYSDIGPNNLGYTPGAGDINASPTFVNPPANYRLANGSAGINQGDPAAIYNDPDCSCNDMGAYGGPGEILWPDSTMAGADPDFDDFTNSQEMDFGTDACTFNPDFDFDGLPDQVETNTGVYLSKANTGTDPYIADTDNDLLNDGPEVLTYNTNPNNPDTDSDLLMDGTEVLTYNTNPLVKDTDGGGKWDGVEVYYCSSDPAAGHAADDILSLCLTFTDADQDGLNDTLDSDPSDRDTDDDGLLDGQDYYWFEPSHFNQIFDADNGGAGDGAEMLVNFTDPEVSSDDTIGSGPPRPGANYFWDLDGDRRATVVDQFLLQKALDGNTLRFNQVVPQNLNLMDLNGDGSANSADLNLLKSLVSGDLSPKDGKPTAIQNTTLPSGNLTPGGAAQAIELTLVDADGTPRNGAGLIFEVTETTGGITNADVIFGGTYAHDASAFVDPDTGFSYPFGAVFAVTGQPNADGRAKVTVQIAGGADGGTVTIRGRLPGTPDTLAKGLAEVTGTEFILTVQNLTVTAIDVKPNAPVSVNEDSSLQFNSICTWDDSSTSNCTSSTSWSVISGAGTITSGASGGLFTPGTIAGCTAAMATVQGLQDGATDTTVVTVNPDDPANSLDILPDLLSLTEGDATQLTAQCTRQCSHTNFTCTGNASWLVVYGPGWVDGAGLFTATTPTGCDSEQAAVEAEYTPIPSVMGSETITVNKLDSIIALKVHPRNAAVNEGASLQMGATCDWQCGPDVNCTSTSDWSATGAGSMSLLITALFNADQVTQNSTATVTAVKNTLSDSTTVNVINLIVDSDQDGLPDDLENLVVCPRQLDPDSDGDGLCDGNLTVSGVCVAGEDMNINRTVDVGETDPCDPDMDDDGVNDGLERSRGSSPFLPDTDFDFIPDSVEVPHACLDPTSQDTDGDGIMDGATPADQGEDQNRNGIVDAGETDPCLWDTDGDQLSDGQEKNVFFTDPLKADTDGDWLTDKEEICYDSNCNAYTPGADTNPNAADTDGGGASDYVEVRRGTDPLAPGDDCSLGNPQPSEADARLDQGGNFNAAKPVAATDGANEILTVWEDARTGAHLQARLIEGLTVSGNDFQIDSDFGSTSRPAVAFASKYLVVWQDNRNGNPDVYARAFLPGGSPALSEEFRVDQDSGFEAATAPRVVATSDTRFMIAWVDQGNAIWGRDCSVNFSCANATQLVSGNTITGLDLFSDMSSSFWLTWAQAGNIKIQKFNLDGVAQGNPVVLNAHSGTATRPALACNSAEICLVAWEDSWRGGGLVDLYANILKTGTLDGGTEFRVDGAAAASKQSQYPALVMDTSGSFGIYWQDNRNGDLDIFGKLFTAAGQIQSCEFPVDRGGAAQAQRPAVVREGNSTVIFWQDNRERGADTDIYGNRFGGVSKRIYLTIPSGDLTPGQEFWVSVYASTESTTFGMYQLTLRFDSNYLEFVSLPAPVSGDADFEAPWFQTVSDGEVKIWAKNNDMGSCTTAGNLHLADVLFRLSWNAPMGLTTQLDLVNSSDTTLYQIFNCTSTDVSSQFGTEGVMVETQQPCATYGSDQFMDCNGDGVINYQDVIMALALVSGQQINTVGTCFTNVGGLQCDINGNGYVDENDVGFLKSFIRTNLLFSGENGVCETTASGDDIQEIAPGNSSTCAICVTAGDTVAGLNPATTLLGDDTVGSSTLVTSGADGICQTYAAPGDVQTTPVGEGCYGAICVTAGPDGDIDTTPSEDDYVLDMSLNLAHLCSCVAAGGNSLITTPSGDDLTVSANKIIAPGDDGVCNTAAAVEGGSTADIQVTPVGKTPISLPGSPKSLVLVSPSYTPYYVDVYAESRVTITVKVEDENGMPRCGISPKFEVISGDAIFENNYSTLVEGIPSCSGMGVRNRPSGEVTVTLIPGAQTSTIQVSLPTAFSKCVGQVPPLTFDINPTNYQPSPDYLCATASQSGQTDLGQDINVDIYLASHLAGGGTVGIVGRSKYLQVLTSRNYTSGAAFGGAGQQTGDMVFLDDFENLFNWTVPTMQLLFVSRVLVEEGNTFGFFQGQWVVRAVDGSAFGQYPVYMKKIITGLGAYENLMIGFHAHGGMYGGGEIEIQGSPDPICIDDNLFFPISPRFWIPPAPPGTMPLLQDPVPLPQLAAGAIFDQVCIRVAFYPDPGIGEIDMDDIYIFGQKTLFKATFDSSTLGEYPSEFDTPSYQGADAGVVVTLDTSRVGRAVKFTRNQAGAVDSYTLEKHLDLGNLQDATLSFEVKDGGIFNGGVLEPWQGFVVEVNDGGGYGQWVQIWSMDWQPTDWTYIEIPLSGDFRYSLVGDPDPLVTGDEFRIRWVAKMDSTESGGDPDAVYLDRVQITGNPKTKDDFRTVVDQGNGHYTTTIRTFDPTYTEGDTLEPTQIFATYEDPNGYGPGFSLFLDSTWSCPPPILSFVPRKVVMDPSGLTGAPSPYVYPDTFTVNACQKTQLFVFGRYQDSPSGQWEDLTNLFTFQVSGPATIAEDGWLQADCFKATDTLAITVNAVPRYSGIYDPGGTGGGQQTGYLSGKLFHTYSPYAAISNVQVHVSENSQHLSATTLSDGSYSFQDVPVYSSYIMKVTKSSYRGKTETGITVNANETTTKNVYQATGSDTDGDTINDLSDTDDDGDGLSDTDETTAGTTKTNPDTDGDGYLDGEDAFPTSAGEWADSDSDSTGDNSDADDDNDEFSDTEETTVGTDGYITTQTNPDSDGDMLCDGETTVFWGSTFKCWAGEAKYDTNPNVADTDGDDLSDVHEIFNGSDPSVADDQPWGKQGVGYFGDSDGSLSLGAPDRNQMVLVLSGNSPSYASVYPATSLVQDFDGSGSIGAPDLTYLTLILSGNEVSPTGWPNTMTKLLPEDSPSVSVGYTVGIKVKLSKDGLARPGLGVVFSVESGSASLYGGEGAATGYTSGARYDLTNASGEARMTLKVNAAGAISVKVELPATTPSEDKMNGSAVTLSPNVSITGI